MCHDHIEKTSQSNTSPNVAAHACHPRIWEAGAGESWVRPVPWATILRFCKYTNRQISKQMLPQFAVPTACTWAPPSSSCLQWVSCPHPSCLQCFPNWAHAKCDSVVCLRWSPSLCYLLFLSLRAGVLIPFSLNLGWLWCPWLAVWSGWSEKSEQREALKLLPGTGEGALPGEGHSHCEDALAKPQIPPTQCCLPSWPLIPRPTSNVS